MIKFFLDLIYPPKCIVCNKIMPLGKKKWVCDNCIDSLDFITTYCCTKCGKPVNFKNITCSLCRTRNFSFIKNYSVFTYDEVISSLIKKSKYNNHPIYCRAFAFFMKDYFEKNINQEIDFIMPVPMFKKKQLQRGFNQASVISKELSKLINIPVLENNLVRVVNTKAQSSLSYNARMSNLDNAFELKNEKPISSKKILLIDDIYTTGSTIDACSKVLLENGALEVYSFCFSIVVKKE